MVETKVTKIGGTLFARIPAEEARRLGIVEGAVVDLQVQPLGRSARDVLRHKGRFKGQLAVRRDADLWGDA